MLVLRVTIANGKIAGIDVVADPDHLGRLEIAVPTAERAPGQKARGHTVIPANDC